MLTKKIKTEENSRQKQTSTQQSQCSSQGDITSYLCPPNNSSHTVTDSQRNHSGIKRTLTADSTGSYHPSQREEDRQRETPTSQEIRDLLGLPNNILAASNTITTSKQTRRVVHQKAVNTALENGIFAQLSCPSSLSIDTSSQKLLAESQASVAIAEETLSQLEQEQANIVAYIALWKTHRVSLDERRLYANSLKSNLEKQAAVIAAKQASAKEKTKPVRENYSPSY